MSEILITVRRTEKHPTCTRSYFDVQNNQFGVGVEDVEREVKIHGETAIPKGRYLLGTHFPSRFSAEYYYRADANRLVSAKDYKTLPVNERAKYTPHELIQIEDVPNFQYVLIHWGNTDLDTHGCYIVGTAFGTVNGRPGVIQSRDKYVQLYTKVFPLIKAGGQYIEFK